MCVSNSVRVKRQQRTQTNELFGKLWVSMVMSYSLQAVCHDLPPMEVVPPASLLVWSFIGAS